jgi:hypothetical protein
MKTNKQFECILTLLTEGNKGMVELKEAMQEMLLVKEEFDT